MTKVALIYTSPPISDPRELNTIISTSVRSTFGDCQAHTLGLRILECRPIRNGVMKDPQGNTTEAIIECPDESLSYIRAALTMPSPPSYLQDTLYSFDFVKVDDKSSNPDWVH